MTNIELEAAKTAVVGETLNIDNVEQLDRVKHLLHSFREEEKAPCRFTLEKLRREIAAAEAEFAENGICYTAEVINREIRREMKKL